MKGEQKYSEVVKDCRQTSLLVQGSTITLKLVYDHVHLPKFQCTWQTRVNTEKGFIRRHILVIFLTLFPKLFLI